MWKLPAARMLVELTSEFPQIFLSQRQFTIRKTEVGPRTSDKSYLSQWITWNPPNTLGTIAELIKWILSGFHALIIHILAEGEKFVAPGYPMSFRFVLCFNHNGSLIERKLSGNQYQTRSERDGNDSETRKGADSDLGRTDKHSP